MENPKILARAGRTPLHVDALPCPTCPYRKDTPSGVWAPEEYEKLRNYDDNTSFATFLCHQSNIVGRDAVCRGWLSVHCESVAVRLAVMTGEVPPGSPYAEVGTELYASGNEAADAGLKGVKRPGRKAKEACAKLDRLRRQRRYRRKTKGA